MPHAPVLSARGLTVRYDATTALDGVDLDIGPGEVHAIVGENGAGKSTLLRVVAGSTGVLGGRCDLHPGTRIAWVPQEPLLPPDLTASAWIFLASELRTRLGFLARGRMDAEARQVLAAIGSAVRPEARLGSLSAPERKQVQIARAVCATPDLLLLDEPTAVLSGADTERLFTAIRELRARGTAVLYVSHRLDEVLAIADSVTVLRDGRRVSTDPVAAVDVPTLVQRMVGRDIARGHTAPVNLGDVVLRVRDLASGPARNVSFDVRQGEIVGLAGLVGAGRSEVLEAIAGLRRLRAGHVASAAVPALLPEDRSRKGLVGALCVRENLWLPPGGTLLRPGRERRATVQWLEQLAIRARGPEAAIESLSGGNQQKLLLARVLRRQPRLLLLDEPTAGIDVGTKADIHDIVRRLAASGAAVLLASSELPELLVLCDRIVALYGGTVVGTLDTARTTEPEIAALITGTQGSVGRIDDRVRA